MRFESSLYFANVERFRKALVSVTGKDPSIKEETRQDVKLENGTERRQNAEQHDITYSGVIQKILINKYIHYKNRKIITSTFTF